jgi:hypothetical protein
VDVSVSRIVCPGEALVGEDADPAEDETDGVAQPAARTVTATAVYAELNSRMSGC